jgi:hypothetical protein
VYDPIGHARQFDDDVAPVIDEYVPSGHARHVDHDVAPVALE